MFFWEKSKCEAFAKSLGLSLDDLFALELCDVPRHAAVKINLEDVSCDIIHIARTIVDCLGEYQNCLLWVTSAGIWPFAQNLHLYYKLRQSYGDTSQIGELPGHFFMNFEKADLITFTQLALMFGWDVHIIPSPCLARAFICHDSWFRIESDGAIQTVIARFQRANVCGNSDGVSPGAET